MFSFGKILQNALTSDFFYLFWKISEVEEILQNEWPTILYKYKTSVLSHLGRMVLPMMSPSNQKEGKRVALFTLALCGWISSTLWQIFQ